MNPAALPSTKGSLELLVVIEFVDGSIRRANFEFPS